MKLFNLVHSVGNYIRRRNLERALLLGGGTIGKHTVITNLSKTMIDISRPYLIEIGDYCVIAAGATILTHDYSLSTVRRVYGEWIGEGG